LLDEISSLIRQNLSPPFILSFYGGEPLLEFQTLKHVVKRLRNNFDDEMLSFSIATNGLLLKDNIRKFLIENNFRIQLSIDGDAEVVDMERVDHQGRGTSTRLAHITSSVREFPNLMARMTITPRNSKFFDNSLQYLVSIGFSDKFHPIRFDHDFTANWSESSLGLLEAAYAKVASFLIEHYRFGGCALIQPLDRIYSNQKSIASCEGSRFCGAGTMQRFVSPQGHVYGCNRLTPAHQENHKHLELGISLVSDETINALLHTIHPNTQAHADCGSCNAKNYCNQSCPARRYSSSSSFSVVSDVHCRITKATYSLGNTIKAFANLEGWRAMITD
jgi:uncharacterized protein